MKLLVTGEKALFGTITRARTLSRKPPTALEAALEATVSSLASTMAQSSGFFDSDTAPSSFGNVEWEITPSTPLAAEHNKESLLSVLQRSNVDDVFFFSLPTKADGQTKKYRLLDPALTAIELGLNENDPIFLSINPLMYIASHHVDNVQKRRENQAHEDDSDEAEFATAAPAADGSLQHSRADVVETAKQAVLRSEVAAASLNPVATAGFAWSTCGDSVQVAGMSSRKLQKTVGPDSWMSSAGLASASLTAECNKVTFRISVNHDVATKEGHGDSKLPDRIFSGSSALPMVMVGLADDGLPLDDVNPTYSSYARSWMLDVLTGALYCGNDPRPTFLDAEYFHTTGSTVEVTFMLDTDRGNLQIVQCGKSVGGLPLPKYLAGALYPCAEIFTVGAVVELV